jgi:L-amino acid N-acyltransferase YncA
VGGDPSIRVEPLGAEHWAQVAEIYAEGMRTGNSTFEDVYEGVAECSVYVGEVARGRGVGELLLEALARSADDGGIWTLGAGGLRRTAGASSRSAA